MLIKNLSIPANLFDISITDHTGKDASDRITILHHQHTSSVSTKQKRETSRPLNVCYFNQQFHRSDCRRHVNPQAYSVGCTIGGSHPGYVGSCASNEICVDGLQGAGALHTAFCVSTENFVRIAKDWLTHETTPAAIHVGFHPQAGSQYTVEAVMTSFDSHTTVVAASLEIEAQTSETRSNVPSWRTLNGGTNQCNMCASVQIANVPTGTQRIYVHVDLQAATVGGLLYLTQIIK